MIDSAHGTTRVTFETGPDGRPRLDLRAGLLVPRVLARTVGVAEVALVGGGALLLGGDRVEIEIVVGAGCRLDLVDIGGTVAYDGEGRRSAWNATIVLGDGAHLSWAGLPFVVSTGADVERRTRVTLGSGAALALRETLVLGRDRESGGRLVARTDITSPEGPLLVEEILLDGGSPVPGVAAGHRVLDTVVVAGRRPPPDRDVVSRPGGVPEKALRLDLEAPGALARWLGSETHRSPIVAVWAEWAQADVPLGLAPRAAPSPAAL